MYVKRAILVYVTMASGKRCTVAFDRFGLNKALFDTAREQGWDAERTVAQAVSEALHAALRDYTGDRTVDYKVVEVD